MVQPLDQLAELNALWIAPLSIGVLTQSGPPDRAACISVQDVDHEAVKIPEGCACLLIDYPELVRLFRVIMDDFEISVSDSTQELKPKLQSASLRYWVWLKRFACLLPCFRRMRAASRISEQLLQEAIRNAANCEMGRHGTNAVQGLSRTIVRMATHKSEDIECDDPFFVEFKLMDQTKAYQSIYAISTDRIDYFAALYVWDRIERGLRGCNQEVALIGSVLYDTCLFGIPEL